MVKEKYLILDDRYLFEKKEEARKKGEIAKNFSPEQTLKKHNIRKLMQLVLNQIEKKSLS